MKNKSFTVIELLVVIAIIGLLASIILVSLKGTTKKAKITKGLEFSHSIQHALGSEAVGIWSFDDCPAGTVNDSSGYGNNGTIYGGASCTSDTPHATVGTGTGKYALSFGGNAYVNAGGGESLKVDDKSFTLEAWIKPAANIPTGGRYTVMAFYNPGWIMDLPDDGGTEGYRFYNGSTAYKYNAPGGSISLEWTHFVVTRNLAANKLSIYLNGSLKQSWNMTTVTASTNPLLIGKRTDGSFFNGLIDEVRIYSQTLSAIEIQKHYAEGLARHKNLVIK